jgi:hypothetical protein
MQDTGGQKVGANFNTEVHLVPGGTIILPNYEVPVGYKEEQHFVHPEGLRERGMCSKENGQRK